MAGFTASSPISLEPDQTGEAACARGTPIGVEARIAEGAQPATVNRVYARGSQTDTRQLVDIRHEASRVATCNERRGSRRMLREECIAHFGPDLECRRPDRRPQPHQQFIGRYRQRFERRLEHTTSQPAPASVSRGDSGRSMITEKRSEEHTSELQSLMRNSYAVFCLKKKKYTRTTNANDTKKITRITTTTKRKQVTAQHYIHNTRMILRYKRITRTSTTREAYNRVT